MDKHWRQRSACKGLEDGIFFPKKGGSVREAKRVCNGTKDTAPCPVKDACLAFALSTEEINADRFGVYGGLSAEDRKVKFGGKVVKLWPVKQREECVNGHRYPEDAELDAAGRRKCPICTAIPEKCNYGHNLAETIMFDDRGHRRCSTCYRDMARAAQERYRERKRAS